MVCGTSTFWVGYWLSFIGSCVVKTARNAARFFLLFFGGDLLLVFLIWKVLLGLGLCSDNFCITNCCPLSGPSCALVFYVLALLLFVLAVDCVGGKVLSVLGVLVGWFFPE